MSISRLILNRKLVLMHQLVHSDPDPIDRLITTISRRFVRQGIDGDPRVAITNILDNSAKLPANISRQLRNHAFNIVHQCIFTNDRAKNFSSATECSFCGHHEETCEHLFVHCPVARSAIAHMCFIFRGVKREAAEILSKATWRDHKLESKGLDVKALRALLCFSLAVWKTRRFYTGNHKPSASAGAARISLEFSNLFGAWRRGGRRDKEVERRSFEACLRLIPERSLRIYVDGSSFGNPGPAGAGYVVSWGADPPHLLGARHLGVATNNVAELQAILDALKHVDGLAGDEPVFFFVDNRAAMRVAIGRVSPGWAGNAAAEVRSLLCRVVTARRAHFVWVPGHAGIDGNESADRVAKLGASGVTGVFNSLDDLPDVDPPSAPPDVRGPAGSGPQCEWCARARTRSQLSAVKAPTRPAKPKRKRAKAVATPSRRYNLRSTKRLNSILY